MMRCSLIALPIVAILAGAALVPPSPATAAESAVQKCTGTNTAEFDPGVMIQPRNNNIKATAPLTCFDSDRPAGFLEAHGHGVLSCISGDSTGTAKIAWDGAGGTSSFTWTAVVAVRPAGNSVLVFTGTVTNGPYLGKTINLQIALASTDPDECLDTPGMQQASGPIQVEIA